MSESVIGDDVKSLDGAESKGSQNVYDAAVTPRCDAGPVKEVVTLKALWAARQPFVGAGVNASEFKIPPRPVPHASAGQFTLLPPLKRK